MSNRNNILTRAKDVLSQDRTTLNFKHYTPSNEHQQRMKQLATTVPSLFDNPDITPRSKWFTHKNWHRNSQMPPYHIHYREEMQSVIGYLYEAYSHPRSQFGALRAAESLYRGCMRGLHGHVQIEEHACFPIYRSEFPEVDVEFLWKDHEDLHESEEKVHEALRNVMQDASCDTILPRENIMGLMEIVLDFDEQLMAHLGEEEEVVVPMSLTEKEIWF